MKTCHRTVGIVELDKTVKENQKHTLDTFDNERKNSDNNIISTVVWDDVSDIVIWYYVTEVSLKVL